MALRLLSTACCVKAVNPPRRQRVATLNRMSSRFAFVVSSLLAVGLGVRVHALEVTPMILEIRPSTVDIERLIAEQGDYRAEHGLDRLHNRLFLGVQEQLLEFDHRFLETDSVPISVPVSPFRVGIDATALNRDGSINFKDSVDFDISLNLPNIEQSLDVFITTDTLSESALERAADTLRAGLRYDPTSFLDLELGAKLVSQPVGFAALRAGTVLTRGKWRIEPFAKVFTETDEGFGAAGSVLLDRWRDRHLLRSLISVRWLRETGDMGWSYQFVSAWADAVISADRQLSRVRNRDLGDAVGLHLEVGGRNRSSAEAYEAGLFWKRPLHGRWLFLSVEPLVRFERQRDWRADPGVRIGIDALFWDVAR